MQHAFDLSDDDVVWQWVERPYSLRMPRVTWGVLKKRIFLYAKPLLEARFDPSSRATHAAKPEMRTASPAASTP
uniref:Uncharacterized protein n=1 Tax=Paraburkholderia sprentiae WSM5005 TaxID=754502 RepID=A0A1I9YU29_9BURK